MTDFIQITTDITAPRGESTYLYSRQAFDARNAWAQSLIPGSTWSFEATDEHGAVVASGSGFATHGKAVAAMYAADDRFTSVTGIDADSTHWDVLDRDANGRSTKRVIGKARVCLVAPASSNRELVRSEAAANGWRLLTFAACDSFARKGTIAKIWWTDRDTATAAVLNPYRVAYASEDIKAEPRMAIVRMRDWLAR